MKSENLLTVLFLHVSYIKSNTKNPLKKFQIYYRSWCISFIKTNSATNQTAPHPNAADLVTGQTALFHELLNEGGSSASGRSDDHIIPWKSYVTQLEAMVRDSKSSDREIIEMLDKWLNGCSEEKRNEICQLMYNTIRDDDDRGRGKYIISDYCRDRRITLDRSRG